MNTCIAMVLLGQKQLELVKAFKYTKETAQKISIILHG
jgi:hypothetical protein